jgi:hypothetical protein
MILKIVIPSQSRILTFAERHRQAAVFGVVRSAVLGASSRGVGWVGPAWSGIADRESQYASLEMTSPPLMVPSALQVIPATELFTNRALPSPNRVFTPPGW